MEEEEAIPIYFLEVLHGGRCNSEVGQTRPEQRRELGWGGQDLILLSRRERERERAGLGWRQRGSSEEVTRAAPAWLRHSQSQDQLWLRPGRK